MYKTSVTAVHGLSSIIEMSVTNGRNWIDFACQLPYLGNRSRHGLPNFMLPFKYSTMYHCLPIFIRTRNYFFRAFYQWFAEQSRLALLPDTPLKNINQIFIK